MKPLLVSLVYGCVLLVAACSNLPPNAAVGRAAGSDPVPPPTLTPTEAAAAPTQGHGGVGAGLRITTGSAGVSVTLQAGRTPPAGAEAPAARGTLEVTTGADGVTVILAGNAGGLALLHQPPQWLYRRYRECFTGKRLQLPGMLELRGNLAELYAHPPFREIPLGERHIPVSFAVQVDMGAAAQYYLATSDGGLYGPVPRAAYAQLVSQLEETGRLLRTKRGLFVVALDVVRCVQEKQDPPTR